MIKQTLFSGVLLLILAGCQVYHDTTSRYNGYFLAKEKMLEVEETLFGHPQDNFNDILHVLVEIDSNYTKSQKAGFDYIIEKASLPIQWHPVSKWVDDCYILVAKARLYQEDYGNAVSTLRYVNGNSDDPYARHKALIWLMRTFLEQKELNNFKMVQEAIQKEKGPFSDDNLRDYHLTMAHYYRQKEDFELLAAHLELAVPLVKPKKKRARLHFLLGQVYQLLGEDDEAFKHYHKTLKSHPNYEVFFHTKLNQKAVEPLKTPKDIAKAEKFYKRQLRDEKNWEYRDKIYYELALFELQRDSVDQTVRYLNESVQVSTSNPTQKGYSYLKLGELYYQELKDFEKAAAYYDSTVQTLPETVKNYQAIKERSEILQEFVKQLNTVRQEERLLMLADMPVDKVELFLEKEIEAEKENIIKQKENERLSARKRQRVEVASTIGNANKESSGWYFYNSNALVYGQSNFLRIWGSRALEDDWRRSQKPLTAGTETLEEELSQPTASEPEEDLFASVKSKQSRMQEIPTTMEEIQASKLRLQEGLYHLGKIYNYQLKEYENALETFERLYNEYPKSEFTPESLYILYLRCKEYEGCDPEKYRKIIIEEYPETFFAKILQNPNYVEETNINDKKVEGMYENAYRHYHKGLYEETSRILNEIKVLYPENSYMDKVSLLNALVLGKTTAYVAEYYAALNLFIQNYPESELVPFAKKLVESISQEDLKKGALPWRVNKKPLENE
ncbi:tetratricopeptide repeat protein [Rapidithrix thailandica]|uniref:Tetratricopeptide repeat protein n=1 Tax=Rapidithrix thailandica TaxID=413964 RepID=A0AAW9S6C9_9BACT